jgi:uncharacterized protein DUF4386
MNSPYPNVDRNEMRVGSVVLLIGGIGGFVANIFHPHDFPSETEPLLRMVAQMPHWSHLHFLIMISVVLLVVGLAMLTRNLADPMGRALGTLGRYLIIMGGTVYMVEVMVDGFAMRYFAKHWAAATDPAQKAALLTSGDAVVHTWFALFPVFAGVFTGLSMAVIGAAILKSGNFPRWLGAWGMVGGTLCLVTGFGAGLGVAMPIPVWIAGVTLIATWSPIAGVMMWRASSNLQPEKLAM